MNICAYLTTIGEVGFEIIALLYKLATLVEGDPKAPFSIATTPRCRGFPGLLHFYLDPLPYNAEC